ncbi:hypothetical protein ACHAXS_000831 [Conticribra weissflogii]
MAFRLRRDVIKPENGESTSKGLKGLLKRSLPSPNKYNNGSKKHHPPSHHTNYTIVKIPSKVKKPKNFLYRNPRSSFSSDQNCRLSSELEDKFNQHGGSSDENLQSSHKSTLTAEEKMTNNSEKGNDPKRPRRKYPASAEWCKARTHSSQVPSGMNVVEHVSGNVDKLKRLPTEGTYLSYQSRSEREGDAKVSSFRGMDGKGRRRSSAISEISVDIAPSTTSRHVPSMIASGGSGEQVECLHDSEIFEDSELSDFFAARAALMAFKISNGSESSLERLRDSFCS